MTGDAFHDTLLRMAPTSRRVDISFDREREAFRTLFDAVAQFRRGAPGDGPAPAHDVPPHDVPAQDVLARDVPTPGANSSLAPAATSQPPSDAPSEATLVASRPAATPPQTALDVIRETAWLDDDAGRTRRPIPVSKTGQYLAKLTEAYGPLVPGVLAADTPFVDTLVLDASALTALAAGDMRARAHVARAVGSLARIVVPATSLRDATSERIARSFADIVTVDTAHVRLAATLLIKAPGADPYDALAVACAVRADRAAIVTTQASELEPLLAAAGSRALYLFSI